MSRLRRPLVVAGAVVVVLAGGVVAVQALDPFGAPKPAASAATTGTGLATVTRRSVSARTTVNGTLGYAGGYAVVNQASGVLTSAASVGRVVRRGEVLYRVNGQPVILMYGSMPAYRALAAGKKASDVKGPDVRQLNANLAALGYDTNPDSQQFSGRTTRALKELQEDLGVAKTGKLALGQVVFLPAALRVTSVAGTVGAPVMPGGTVMQASSTGRQVTVKLNTDQQSQLKAGDTVTIKLPNGKTTGGKVAAVGKVANTPASAQESPTVDVTITLTDPDVTGTLDRAPVAVEITTSKVDNALVVPVEALLALANGGYAVEVVGKTGVHKLVPVSLGLFDDDAGVVQVTETTLQAGQRVVVPST